MSNRLVGALSRRRDRRLRFAVPSARLPSPRAWGHRAGAHDDFRGLEHVPPCQHGSI